MLSGVRPWPGTPGPATIAAGRIAVVPALVGIGSPESVNCWKPWSEPYVSSTFQTPSAPLRSIAFAVVVESVIVKPSEIENGVRWVITGDPGGVGGCGGT